VRDGIDDLLAVELQHDPKHAMHARMVRAEIEKHELICLAATSQSPPLGLKAQSLLLHVLSCLRELEWARFRRPGGVVLAQRMATPGRRHEDPSQVRMAL